MMNTHIEPKRQLHRGDGSVLHVLCVHDDEVGAALEHAIGRAHQVTVAFRSALTARGETALTETRIVADEK